MWKKGRMCMCVILVNCRMTNETKMNCYYGHFDKKIMGSIMYVGWGMNGKKQGKVKEKTNQHVLRAVFRLKVKS